MHVFLIVYLYQHCRSRSHYQLGKIGTPLIGLTLQHLYAFPKPGSEFSTSYFVIFFVICVRWFGVKVVIRFVDFDRIVDHNLYHFILLKRV